MKDTSHENNTPVIGSVQKRTTPHGMLFSYQLFIPSTLAFFEGHFPDTPLLPGVAQIHWAITLAHECGANGEFISVDRLKFKKPIRPDLDVVLALNISSDSKEVTFSYTTQENEYSSGKICLGAPHV